MGDRAAAEVADTYLKAACVADLLLGLDSTYGGWYFTESGKVAPVEDPKNKADENNKFFTNEQIQEEIDIKIKKAKKLLRL